MLFELKLPHHLNTVSGGSNYRFGIDKHEDLALGAWPLNIH